ncbi:MAG: hypothetical protein ABW204_01830 [Microbacteriaceae bacterium]
MSRDETSGPKRTSAERRRSRRYTAEFLSGMALVVVLLLLPSEPLLARAPQGARVLWAVLPLVPLLWSAAAVVRHLRRVDELQRRMVVDALAWGFGAAMIAAIGAALIRSAGVAVGDVEWAVFLSGMLGFAVAAAIGSARASR